MNYALLLNEEIVSTKPPSSEKVDPPDNPPVEDAVLRGIPIFAINLKELNTTNSYVTKCLDTINGSQAREISKDRRRNNYEKGKLALADLDRARRLTSGYIFGMTTQIAQEAVLQLAEEKFAAMEQAEAKKKSNALARKVDLHKRVRTVYKKSRDYKEWTLDELGAMLQYHKVKGNPAMASDIAGRQAQWLVQKERNPEALLTAERIDNLANSSTINLTIPIAKSETQEPTIGNI